ncbi:acyltransferase [Shewanella sp. 5S214]|uniref:acyltransferase n=1 Tax=Shewanella sp. 5S214 TaxID=3229999 RepID=UPI00352E97E7
MFIKKFLLILKMLALLFYNKLLYGRSLKLNSLKVFVDGEIIVEREGVVNFVGTVHARRYSFLNVQGGVLTIGDKVFFNRNCSLNCRGRISIGDGCLFGENVKVYDHDHEFSFDNGVSPSKFKVEPISIGINTWIGSNVIILKGVNIGSNSVIGAGSIVTKDVGDNVIFYQKREAKEINIT